MKTFQWLFTACLSFLCFMVSGQNWEVAWNKNIDNQLMSYFQDVIEDNTGGYTVLGSVYPRGSNSSDLWLVHFSEDGDTIWSEVHGTAFTDVPKKVIQSGDGYLVLGSTAEGNTEKLHLIKTDARGKELWSKSFDDAPGCRGEDVISTGDGFLVVGSKTREVNSKRWMAKIDNNGSIIWEKEFQDSFDGCCRTVRQLPDGGIAVTGQATEAGKKNCNVWIARLDASMEAIWETRIPSPGLNVWPECLCCSPDSGFMVVGWQGTCLNDINSNDPVFDYDLILFKVDKAGKVVWTKNFDREGSEGGSAVVMRPDGNMLVAGAKVTSFLGKTGPWLLLVDQSGNLISEKLVDMHFTQDKAAKVINSSDGGVVVIGPGIQQDNYSRSNGWIMKFTL